MSIGRFLLVACLVASSVPAASPAFAASDYVPRQVIAAGSPSKPTKPKPKVTANHKRESLRLNGTQGTQDSRTEDLPRKPEAKKPSRPISHTPVREQRAETSDQKQGSRFHDSGCNPTDWHGKVEGPNVCPSEKPDKPQPTRAVVRRIEPPQPKDVTWEQVRSETKDVSFPGLSVKVQPAGRTLVNLETIVYTDESKVTTSNVTLLGFPVVVEATPVSYTWHFGDGSPALTTTYPGKPYPSKEITHKYMQRGDVNVTLTTNYAARFNVAGTGWQVVGGTFPATGPATPLQVREAVPVLVDPDR